MLRKAASRMPKGAKTTRAGGAAIATMEEKITGSTAGMAIESKATNALTSPSGAMEEKNTEKIEKALPIATIMTTEKDKMIIHMKSRAMNEMKIETKNPAIAIAITPIKEAGIREEDKSK